MVVHERGARHLADPSRLIDSAARVYGPLLDDLYGRMLPVPAERVLAAADGMALDLGGGRSLRLVDAPGHAQHHQAVLDEQSGTLLVGDAVGVRLPGTGALRPATPPPDFDLEQAVATLLRLGALHPARLVLTHYGPVADPGATLAEAEEDTSPLGGDGRTGHARNPRGRGWKRLPPPSRRPSPPRRRAPPRTPAGSRSSTGCASNAAGIVRYLESRTAARPAA